jgi:hypothetical protein
MNSSEQIIRVLRQEFDAEDGSFLIQLRCDLVWDKTAFSRLVDVMHSYVSQTCDEPRVERWIANGFWYLETFVRDWTQHPSFPRVYAAEYYESAYQRLHDLAYWLFDGKSPYIGGTGFEPL